MRIEFEDACPLDTSKSRSYALVVEVELTLDQEALVRQVIASGRVNHEAEIVQEAFSLWESRERRRIEILAALDAAESDLEAGHFTDYTNSTLPDLAASAKHALCESRLRTDDVPSKPASPARHARNLGLYRRRQ